jgi:small-conductance mechanosensitive channel
LGGVRADVNLAVLDALNGAGVEIPFPQRVVRMVGEAIDKT